MLPACGNAEDASIGRKCISLLPGTRRYVIHHHRTGTPRATVAALLAGASLAPLEGMITDDSLDTYNPAAR
jgi:hypothetical protein